MKLKNKIFITFLIASILISISYIFAFYLISKNILFAEINNNLQNIAVSKADKIKFFLEELKTSTLIISHETNIKKFLEQPDDINRNELKYYWNKIEESNKDILKISVIDKNGQILAYFTKSDTPSEEQEAHLDLTPDEIQTIIKNRNVYLKDTHASGVNHHGFDIALPILENNVVLGIVIFDIDINKLYKIIANEQKVDKTNITYLINKQSYLITPTESNKTDFFKLKIHTLNSEECLEDYQKYGSQASAIEEHQEKVLEFNDYLGRPVLGAHAYVPEMRWCVLVEIPRKLALAPFEKLAYFSLLLIFGLGLVIYIISKLLSASISTPIKSLRDGASIIANGNYDYKVNIQTKNEIGQLADSFNKMSAAVKQSRADVDQKVKEQTQKIIENNNNIENQKKAILNILEDVSAERDQVSKERDKTNTILKSIGDGVMVVNQEQKIEFINPVAAELTGWSLTEAIGSAVEDVFNIFDEEKMVKRQSPIDEAIKTGQIKNLSNHTVLKTKDGQIIPIADSAAPIKDAQGNVSGAILVFRDVIKERMAEEKLLMAKNDLEKLNLVLDQKVDQRTKELQKAYDELMSLDTMKDEFLNISAHELKTPLTSIIGLSEIMILKKQGTINIKQKKSLVIVNNEANRLLNIIKKILGITRIEAGKTVFDLQETDLYALAFKMIDSLKPIAAKQKVQLICQKPDQPVWVKVDPERIQEVIYNLIDNSLKFSPPNSKIFISGEIKNKDFIFSVKDQGAGIDPSKMDKLFQKFSQLDTGFSRKQEGTGLGLYICKIIMDNMNGKIWAESKPGQGATFKFSLPLAK